jgi:hypothetical protein
MRFIEEQSSAIAELNKLIRVTKIKNVLIGVGAFSAKWAGRERRQIIHRFLELLESVK